jgi:hypothetical protein
MFDMKKMLRRNEMWNKSIVQGKWVRRGVKRMVAVSLPLKDTLINPRSQQSTCVYVESNRNPS